MAVKRCIVVISQEVLHGRVLFADRMNAKYQCWRCWLLLKKPPQSYCGCNLCIDYRLLGARYTDNVTNFEYLITDDIPVTICIVVYVWFDCSTTTDRVSKKGNAVNSAPSARLLTFQSKFWTKWPLTWTFCLTMDHDHNLPGIEGQSHRSRSKVKM